MKNSNTFDSSVIPSQLTELSKTSFTQKPKTNRPKLSMIWVKEFDGERQRLVAKWTIQD
ncbi:hypothetical protein ACE1CI_21165 [Aerosakkonemataceae cyanobacterium BLCC-F50]|uniref:Uncharacterized protein n=1 Tax=Floridaenema flaviceps BLCC-F50 TaxID=3153642 RepID=A0ABV4XVH9_9CYAN